MAVGLPIPNKISERVKKSESLFPIAIKIYRPYLNLYIQLWTWFNYDRKNSATLQPFRLLWLSPDEINFSLTGKYQNIKEDYFRPRIKDGDWDKKTRKIESKTIFNSIKMRCEDGKKWEETPIFEQSMGSINGKNNKYAYNAENKEELLESLQKIDNIYYRIKKDGYNLQTELNNSETTANSSNIDKKLPKHKEITISINRNGEPILEDGNHRLSIAKILGLDKIPVRVVCRHKKWQQKRNTAVENPKALTEKLRKHPDIEYLL